MASTLGAVNPFRYRGYYYDAETGFYYLQTRYYDPQVGRFLNADGIIGANGGIMGYNMFAYCNNNPVMYADASGMARLPFEDLAYPGEIHAAVLQYIAEHHNDVSIEVAISGSHLRADMIDNNRGVYELKPATWIGGVQFGMHLAQLQLYIHSLGSDYSAGMGSLSELVCVPFIDYKHSLT